jgi:hypothetical protein
MVETQSIEVTITAVGNVLNHVMVLNRQGWCPEYVMVGLCQPPATDRLYPLLLLPPQLKLSFSSLWLFNIFSPLLQLLPCALCHADKFSLVVSRISLQICNDYIPTMTCPTANRSLFHHSPEEIRIRIQTQIQIQIQLQLQIQIQIYINIYTPEVQHIYIDLHLSITITHAKIGEKESMPSRSTNQ